MLLDISPDWTPSYANFVGGQNIELLSALNHALSNAQTERCLYIWGETGSGKSHLLQASVDKAQGLGLSSVYARGEVPKGAQVVAVDDVEMLDADAQIALFTLYNQQRDAGGMLLVSGLSAPSKLALRDDLRTRLGWGLVYQVQSLSEEEKTLALQHHAVARGFTLSEEVVQYLLRHGRRDLPSLLGVLDMLDEHCLRLKRGASVPLLKEVMQKLV